MTGKIVTVFGATGLTGGNVARALAASGWVVRGVTRDAASDAAAALKADGITPVEANLDDRGAVASAIEGADTVYFVGASLADRWDTGQAIQGIIAAEAAAQAGVEHYIYQSALAQQGRGVLSVGSKRAIEERIAELELPATIVRPATYMDNIKTYFPLSEQDGNLILAMPVPVDVPQQLISATDIGRAGAAVANRRDEFVGKEVSLIADNLSLAQMAEILSEELGRPALPFSIPLEGLGANWPQGVPLFRWLSDASKHGGNTPTNGLVDQPQDFRTWVRANIVPNYR